jgi:polar amino acid transport system substrate-binding protein
MIVTQLPPSNLKLRNFFVSTIRKVYYVTIFLILVVFNFSTESLAANNAAVFPLFRHIDSGAVAPLEMPTGPIKFLTDIEFPPFSFQNTDGAMTGISVDLAIAACAELKITCQFIPKPFAELLPALKNHEGDAIIAGVRLNPDVFKLAAVTRPYFFSSARFITRTGMPFSQPDVKALAGRRLGYVKGTSHAAFLEKYYERAALTPFNDENALLESLRTAAIDAAFTDSMHASFWLKGSNARGCCIMLGESFVDRASFSKSMSMLVSLDQPNLREALDYALDRLEEKNISAKIFARYLPDSPF